MAKKAITKCKKASRGADFWLLVAQDGRIYTMERDGTPAIFSGEGEAEVFWRFGTGGGGWRARRTSPGELVSLLYSRCAASKKVCLDPAPELLCAGVAHLVSMGKERFVERIVKLRSPMLLTGNPYASR
jgi:hypothetical protein